MIGNDIIDLALARKESNWKRKGFLEKLFTPGEQLMISNAENPEITVWNLWSRKEAAYKIHNRRTQKREFIPKQLECFDIETKKGILYGKVICCDRIYFTMTTINPEFIETNAVVNLEDFEDIKAIDLSENILKTNGIPNLFDAETNTWKSISKSHHGRFVRIVSI